MRFATVGRIIGVLFLGAVLSGCSAVRLAYNNLPEFTFWWMDGYVDFNGAQTPRVKDQLNALLAWHRKNELPRLVALLQKAEAMAPNDVTPEQVCALFDEGRARLLAVAEQAAVPGAELAMSLGDAQSQNIERKYAKNNADYASDWLEKSADKVHEKRYEQFLERNEDFYGTLDARQRALMRRLTDQSAFDPQRVDAERRQRQRESLAMLRKLSSGAVSADDARQTLVAYARRISEPPPGPWRDYQQQLLKEGCSYVAQQHNASRPAQREQAVKRLQAYAQDLRVLAAQ